MLNLSLAFFNLLPIPGLDGGRILLVLLGAVKGRPLTHEQENAINFMGFAFVMLLMLFVVVRDVVTRL
jgi:regulator of sigma E protease